MKKISSTRVKLLILTVITCSLFLMGSAGYIVYAQFSEKTAASASTEFYAAITIYVYQGEGCGCVPLRDIFIIANGRDTDHSASNITDQNGMCVLLLEYDKTYRLRIEQEDYESVLFDFIVIDDQMFSFHVKELETSLQRHSFLQMIQQKIFSAKRIIQ